MELEDLDVSWIHEQEQLLNTENYQISPLKKIPIHFVYVNKQGTVENKDTIEYEFVSETIEHETLLLYQQQYQNENYECIDILYYHFQIVPEHIQDFINSPLPAWTTNSSHPYFKKYNGENGIHFSPIIKLFHVFSSVYYFFRQIETIPPPPPPKPILKNGISNGKGITKKVRILCDDNGQITKEIQGSNKHKRNQIACRSVAGNRKTRKRIVIHQ